MVYSYLITDRDYTKSESSISRILRKAGYEERLSLMKPPENKKLFQFYFNILYTSRALTADLMDKIRRAHCNVNETNEDMPD